MTGALTLETRQLLVLCLLARAKDCCLPAGFLRGVLGEEYPEDEDSAQHRFADDLGPLRGAGILRYGSLRAEDDVSLVRWAKDPKLSLSAAEHEALQRARLQLGPRGQLVGPIGTHPKLKKLAQLTAVLRCIEEPAFIDVADVALATGLRPTKIRALLDRLRDLERMYGYAGPAVGLDVETDGVAPRTGQPLATAVGVRKSPDMDRPLADRSLDKFGLFAYGTEEVTDRLKLIESALQRGSPADHATLRSARKKLQAWKAELLRLEVARSK